MTTLKEIEHSITHYTIKRDRKGSQDCMSFCTETSAEMCALCVDAYKKYRGRKDGAVKKLRELNLLKDKLMIEEQLNLAKVTLEGN